jgi:hypothetical protein
MKKIVWRSRKIPISKICRDTKSWSDAKTDLFFPCSCERNLKFN